MAAALQTQPWLAEPVKRIAQDALSPVYVIDVTQTKLEDISKVSVVATPEDITKLGFKVADEIANFADDLAEVADPQAAEQDANVDAMQALAQQIAYDLVQADKPLIISGTSLSSTALIEAAAQITQALTQNVLRLKQRNSSKLRHIMSRFAPLKHKQQLLSKAKTKTCLLNPTNRKRALIQKHKTMSSVSLQPSLS